MLRAWRHPARSVVLLGLVLLLVVVWAVHASEEDDRLPTAPGAEVARGAYTGGVGLPGDLLGTGSISLRVVPGRRYRLVSWRFREVDPPGTRIAYRARPGDTDDAKDCPADRIAFTADAVQARRDGDRYPCAMSDATGRIVTADTPLELIGVYWNSPREGVLTRVAQPEAILEDELGKRFRVEGPGGQTTCAVGIEACARWAADDYGRDDPDEADYEEPSRADLRREERRLVPACHERRRGPLFATPANRPPRPANVERGVDAGGRRCTKPVT